MKTDKFVVLREEIQKGIADLEVGKVRSGKKVLGDLALRVAVRQGLAHASVVVGEQQGAASSM
jgi:hypothetical protein